MDFSYSARTKALRQRLLVFMDEAIYPNERVYTEQLDAGANRWESPPIMEELKRAARAAGLWNLFLPDCDLGAGLTNVEYAPLCEIMGRSPIAPEACNCSAPDTGNMEVLVRYGTTAQKRQWLTPLLEGTTRSAYTMTEPEVASSDATNICARIERDKDHYVINGRKWWASGAGDTRCTVLILMGKTDPEAPKHQQQSMILIPTDTPGDEIVRETPVLGMSGGHCEVVYTDVRVPAANLLGPRGEGFKIAQKRLGPGRIFHCMRWLGQAQRAFDLMCARANSRHAFGSALAEKQLVQKMVFDSAAEIQASRLLTLDAARMIDAGDEARVEDRVRCPPRRVWRVADWLFPSRGSRVGISSSAPATNANGVAACAAPRFVCPHLPMLSPMARSAE